MYSQVGVVGSQGTGGSVYCPRYERGVFPQEVV